MNHSLYAADRATHLKIVVVALLAAVAIAGFSLSLHVYSKKVPAETIAVLKVGKPMLVGSTTLALSR